MFGNLGTQGLTLFRFEPAVPSLLAFLGVLSMGWFRSKALFATVFYLDAGISVVPNLTFVKNIDVGPAMMPFRGRYTLPTASVNSLVMLLCLTAYLLR